VGVFIPRGGLYRCDHRFLLSAKRDTVAAERFLAKALGAANHPQPRVINTDKDAAYPPAIVQLKAEGVRRRTAGIDRCNILITSWNRTIGPSSAGSAQASILVLSGLRGAQSPAMKRFIYPQRPSMLECGTCEGLSGAPLHSRSVRCDLAKFPIIYPDLRLDYKVATHPSRADRLLFTAIFWGLGFVCQLRSHRAMTNGRGGRYEPSCG
jgi:DDE superfamily endonuclease